MQWYCFDMCWYKKTPIVTDLKQFEVFSNIYSKNKYNYLYICIVKQHFCATFLRFAGVDFFAVTKFCETGLEHLPETLRTELRREKFARTRILLTANLCTVNAFANNFSSLVKQHIRRSSIIWCIYMLCKNKMGSYIICHFLTLHVCSSKKNLNSKH